MCYLWPQADAIYDRCTHYNTHLPVDFLAAQVQLHQPGFERRQFDQQLPAFFRRLCRPVGRGDRRRIRVSGWLGARAVRGAAVRRVWRRTQPRRGGRLPRLWL